ncbi:MAG: RNB domain-containing ribonuclease, partial [Deltaproteobacteria bacterium]|nr:RNB domain-containing ribonuclease [Deltaproteobacteria bacterium]
MTERGFLVDFSEAALNELEKIAHVDWGAKPLWKDLRHLLWASIDNDDSLDLDQLTVAEALPDNMVKILV